MVWFGVVQCTGMQCGMVWCGVVRSSLMWLGEGWWCVLCGSMANLVRLGYLVQFDPWTSCNPPEG